LLYPKQDFLRILWCSQSGNNPENNLLKFGYILHMEVEKKKNPFHILGYPSIKIWRFEIVFFKNWQFCTFFH
jgi:hypothetical protein